MTAGLRSPAGQRRQRPRVRQRMHGRRDTFPSLPVGNSLAGHPANRRDLGRAHTQRFTRLTGTTRRQIGARLRDKSKVRGAHKIIVRATTQRTRTMTTSSQHAVNQMSHRQVLDHDKVC